MANLRNIIFTEINEERDRQDSLHPTFPKESRTEVLLEEFGEVGKAKLEGDIFGLRRELIEVAAVCVRWLETLDVEALEEMANMRLSGISPTNDEFVFHKYAVGRMRALEWSGVEELMQFRLRPESEDSNENNL